MGHFQIKIYLLAFLAIARAALAWDAHLGREYPQEKYTATGFFTLVDYKIDARFPAMPDRINLTQNTNIYRRLRQRLCFC